MASGQTLIVWTAAANEPPGTNWATFDGRNGHLVLDFDDTTQETAIFTGVLPRNYSGGGITATAYAAATSATTGTLGLGFSIERIGAVQDLDADSFDTETLATPVTTSGTAGIPVVIAVAIANLDSIAVGEPFRLRVRRDVANDTVVGDLELLSVELKES
jgi:hypothetical protein